MSDVTVGQIDPYDGMDLGAYRYAVAKLLRLLIQARLKQEPEFLDQDDRQCWQVEITQGGSRTIESFLLEARIANDFLCNTFLGPVNSFGIAPGDPRHRLKETVITVATSMWSEADQWIAKARSGEYIDWDAVIPIDVVCEIRDGLDSLPHPPRKTTADADGPASPGSDKGRCELIKDEEVLVWSGVRIDTFTDTEFLLLSMFWDHRERARDVNSFLADCTLKFGWELHKRRSNFDRHKSGINKKFNEAGFKTPISVTNFKVRAWPEPQKLKKTKADCKKVTTKAVRKKNMGTA